MHRQAGGTMQELCGICPGIGKTRRWDPRRPPQVDLPCSEAVPPYAIAGCSVNVTTDLLSAAGGRLASPTSFAVYCCICAWCGCCSVRCATSSDFFNAMFTDRKISSGFYSRVHCSMLEAGQFMPFKSTESLDTRYRKGGVNHAVTE